MYTQARAAVYQAASTETDTHIGLILVAYEALAKQLYQIGHATECQDIPGRCEASNRALSLLGHLESWTVYLDDDALKTSLHEFYASVRLQILGLQTAGSRAGSNKAAEEVLRVRSTWQVKHEQLLRQHGEAAAGRQNLAEPRVAASWCA